MEDPVEVFCRIRPLQNPEDKSCLRLYSSKKVSFSPECMKNKKHLSYTFSHVFTEHADQKEVFEYIAVPLLNGFIKGENGLLFSYGVSGSGKTHTMTGHENNPGIVPRCIYAIFNSIMDLHTPKFTIKSDKMNGFEFSSETEIAQERLKESKNRRQPTRTQFGTAKTEALSYLNDGTKLDEVNGNAMYTCFITYIEIYNNNVFDLLDSNCGQRSMQSKILREDSCRNSYINGVVEVEVKTAAEALDLYTLGNIRRSMGSTNINIDSSRSHSIFNIRLVMSSRDSNNKALHYSQLSLVDLAGSERCSRSNAQGDRLKEAGKINSSLMTLRTCLDILRENQRLGQRKIVPYRESRLTQLFKYYFEGEGKVRMIVCVNPSSANIEETMYVLKFAEYTQEVKVSRPEVVTIKPPEIDNILHVLSQVKEAVDSFNLGSIPQVKSMLPDSEESQELILYLSRLLEHNKKRFNNLQKHAASFRNNLIPLQDYQDRYQTEIEVLLPSERAKVKTLQNNLLKSQVAFDKVNEKLIERDHRIKELEQLNIEKDFQLRQFFIKKQGQQQQMEKISTNLQIDYERKLRQQKAQLRNVMQDQTNRMALAKQVLDDNVEVVAKSDRQGINDEFDDKNVARSSPNKPIEVVAGPSTSNDVISTQTAPIIQKFEKGIENIPHRDVPVANRRYRRSFSTNDTWLEHRPVNPVPLGTVLQPKINIRKKVNKLTDIKDVINPKQSKYLLVSQTADQTGDVETSLFKGDIIPTCSGGAQVIFDDIEKLKQESPTNREAPAKRKVHSEEPKHTHKKIILNLNRSSVGNNEKPQEDVVSPPQRSGQKIVFDFKKLRSSSDTSLSPTTSQPPASNTRFNRSKSSSDLPKQAKSNRRGNNRVSKRSYEEPKQIFVSRKKFIKTNETDESPEHGHPLKITRRRPHSSSLNDEENQPGEPGYEIEQMITHLQASSSEAQSRYVQTQPSGSEMQIRSPRTRGNSSPSRNTLRSQPSGSRTQTGDSHPIVLRHPNFSLRPRIDKFDDVKH